MDKKRVELEKRERELNKRHQIEWDLIAEREREIIERQRREVEELYRLGEWREISELLYELGEQPETAERPEPQEAGEECMCAVEGIDEATWAQIARDEHKEDDGLIGEKGCTLQDEARKRAARGVGCCVSGDEARARLNYDEAILIVRRFQTNVTPGVQLVTDVVWEHSDVWEYQDVVQYVRVHHNRVRVRPDLSVLGEEYRAAEELHKGWVKYSSLMSREEP